MSKTLLNTDDVPEYVREIVKYLRPTTDYSENDIPGYTFRLYGKYKIGYEGQLERNCEKLIDWCQRHYADAYVASKHAWWKEVPVPGGALRGDIAHRKKAYRDGFRNYVKIVITDPVARRFELDEFYRGVIDDCIKKDSHGRWV